MFEITKLRTTINEIWDFIVPPVINIGIVIFLLLIILKKPYILTSEDFANSLLLIKQSTVQEILDAYKISNLLPAISLIIIVFSLNLLNRVFYAIGELVPISLMYNSTNLYMFSDKFRKIWNYYPTVFNPAELVRIVETLTEEDIIRQNANGKYMGALQKVEEKIIRRGSFCKFVMILCVFSFFGNIYADGHDNYQLIVYPKRIIVVMLFSIGMLYHLITRQAILKKYMANYKMETFYINKVEANHKPNEEGIPDNLGEKKFWDNYPNSGWWWIRVGYHTPQWFTFLKEYKKENIPPLISLGKKLSSKIGSILIKKGRKSNSYSSRINSTQEDDIT